jgi:tetratricopeptide (TPR) repeat protein
VRTLMLAGMTAAAHAAPAEAPTAPAAQPAAAVSPSATAPSPAPAAPAGPSCRALTEQALSADLRAASAQSARQEAEQVLALYEEAVRHWRQAAERCEDRARERAQRNLEDSRRAAAALQEVVGSGPQCGSAHKDAASLQELAKTASAERRWSEAAILYRKAESMWDLATERCSGAQQQLAQQRREQSETDGHNAEFCAPVYERAREQTQRLKSSGAGLEDTQRRTLSQVVETLWRDAASRCRGAAQELARTNANAVARERGTPWVATADPGLANRLPAPPAPAAGPVTAAAAATAPALAAAAGTGTAATSAAPLPAATGSTATAAAGPARAPQVQPPEFTSGNIRYSGQFTLNEGSDGKLPTYSGQGRLAWPNGDVYEGLLVHGLRHGQGRFTWANGQHYEGEWVQDRAQGRGRMKFPNGDQYEGQVVDGVPEGTGRMAYASGDSYSGQFARGMPAGRGEYVWRNGQRYEGPWKDQQPHGSGLLRFVNGDVYEGTLVAGVPHGEGRMRYANGDGYGGTFVQGRPEGQGRYDWGNGDHYIGAFKEGRKEGRGTLVRANGDRMEGEFDADEEFRTLAAVAPAATVAAADATPAAGAAAPTSKVPGGGERKRGR